MADHVSRELRLGIPTENVMPVFIAQPFGCIVFFSSAWGNEGGGIHEKRFQVHDSHVKNARYFGIRNLVIWSSFDGERASEFLGRESREREPN